MSAASMTELCRRIEQSLADRDERAQRRLLRELRDQAKDVPRTRVVNIYTILADYLERRMAES